MSNNDNVADLCERLRRKAGFNDPVTGEYVNFPTQPDGPEAADTIERQAAENERLRRALKIVSRASYGGPFYNVEALQGVARHALTGED